MQARARAAPDFAGVALADILANGVAMLIIVIVLTLNARYEQEQEQLEQVDEVSVMLSRQLATSIVMNRLSSSPPARLHDYKTSPLDRVRNPKILPILELHRDFMRDFYSGRIYSRNEMLFEENALDNLIAGFSDGQKQRLRVDIYEVRLFYIAMSILKEHGIVPRHWHFLEGGGMGVGDAGLCPGGTAGGDCRGLGGDSDDAAARGSLSELLAKSAQEEGAGGQNAAEQGAGGEDAERQGTGESSAAGEGSGSGSGTEGALSGPGAGQGRGGTLPPDGAELGWGGPGTGSPEQYQDESVQGRGGQGEGAAEEGLFEQLMQSMTQSPLVSGARSANSGKIKFRWSAPESSGPSQSAPRSGASGPSVPISDVLNYRAVLSGLLEYMRQVQSVLDAGGSPRQLVVGIGEKVGELMKNAPPVRPEDVPRIESLAWHFNGHWPTDELLHLRRFQRGLSGGDVLIVPVNTGLDTVALGAEDGVPLSDYGPPVPARLHVNFSEYPGIYRGLAKELEPDAVLLMPPDADAPEEFRWRVLTYVSPRLDDFVLAFVYAAFDRDGHLLLDVQANQVRVDGGTLRGQLQEKLFGWRGWLVVLYSLLVAALAFFPLASLWSRYRQRQLSGVAESVA